MKTAGIKIKDFKAGGFFSAGHGVVSIFVNEGDGSPDRELGDYFISSTNVYQQKAEIKRMKGKLSAEGYTPVGDWDLN